MQPSSPDITKRPANFSRQLQQLPAFRALLRAVEADFYQDLPMPGPVLDLGCGDGDFAEATFLSPLDVGLDPWWRPLSEAASRRGHRWLTHADGAAMPFPDAVFRTVVSNSVLEHIPQVDPVLVEVSRVLKPGGWFHFAVPGPNFRHFLSVARALDRVGLTSLAERYRRFFDKISRHHYYFEPETWAEHLAAVGLAVVQWWPYFSAGALAALEWGHPLGLPSVLARRLSGRWLLVPSAWNLRVTELLLKRFYEEPLADPGAYVFFSTRRLGT
ncbi:MAG: methyltransferase domain-containing protein [Anaerolineae bacterium]|nr:methyltransferase domain-containing protein [Anaerolineae bacterium]